MTLEASVGSLEGVMRVWFDFDVVNGRTSHFFVVCGTDRLQEVRALV